MLVQKKTTPPTQHRADVYPRLSWKLKENESFRPLQQSAQQLPLSTLVPGDFCFHRLPSLLLIYNSIFILFYTSIFPICSSPWLSKSEHLLISAHCAHCSHTVIHSDNLAWQPDFSNLNSIPTGLDPCWASPFWIFFCRRIWPDQSQTIREERGGDYLVIMS